MERELKDVRVKLDLKMAEHGQVNVDVLAFLSTSTSTSTWQIIHEADT